MTALNGIAVASLTTTVWIASRRTASAVSVRLFGAESSAPSAISTAGYGSWTVASTAAQDPNSVVVRPMATIGATQRLGTGAHSHGSQECGVVQGQVLRGLLTAAVPGCHRGEHQERDDSRRDGTAGRDEAQVAERLESRTCADESHPHPNEGEHRRGEDGGRGGTQDGVVPGVVGASTANADGREGVVHAEHREGDQAQQAPDRQLSHEQGSEEASAHPERDRRRGGDGGPPVAGRS